MLSPIHLLAIDPVCFGLMILSDMDFDILANKVELDL